MMWDSGQLILARLGSSDVHSAVDQARVGGNDLGPERLRYRNPEL